MSPRKGNTIQTPEGGPRISDYGGFPGLLGARWLHEALGAQTSSRRPNEPDEGPNRPLRQPPENHQTSSTTVP
eukprot:5567498-Pyramimonas_sp.AAC.1